MSGFSELSSWEEEMERDFLEKYIRHQAMLLAEKMDNMKECKEVMMAFENVDRTTPPSEVLDSDSLSVGTLPIFTDKPYWTREELRNMISYLPDYITHDDLSGIRELVREQRRQRRGRDAGRLRESFGKVIQKAVSRTNKKLVGLQVFIWGLAYGIPKKEIIHMLKKI